MPDISVTQIVKTVESEEEDVREFVEENELSTDDLKKLIEGEKAAKNRSSVKKYLESKIQEKKVEQQLEQFDQDLEGIEDLLDKYRIDEEETELPQEQVLKLVGSTVDELVNHLEETTYSTDKLEELREAEELVKDRKTAKKAIDEEIKKTKLGEDAERVSEDAESLEEDMEKLEKDLNEGSFETGTDGDFKQRLKQELEKLDSEEEEGLEDVAEAIEEKESEDESEKDPVESHEPEEDTENEEPESDVEEPESPEESEEGEATDEKEEEPEETETDREDEEDTGEENTELEQKKEIIDELELDLSDDELEGIGVDELKQLREEKERREELIEHLKDEFDEEMLRASSTSDLEKLAEDLNSEEERDEEDSSETEEDDEEVDEEKLKEEAEEELQMLMGANAAEKEDEDGDSRFNLKEQIDNTKKQIRDILPGSRSESEDEKTGKMDAGSVKELLDDYSQLNSKEASVKTAHVMKAFLESKLNIEREMTYKELAEYIAENRSSDKMIELAEKFKELHKDQYMGEVSIDDVDSFIQNSKKVADELG